MAFNIFRCIPLKTISDRLFYIRPMAVCKNCGVTDCIRNVVKIDTINLANAKLYKQAKDALGRELNIAKFDGIADTEHSLPTPQWNGTVNIVNEGIRMGYVDSGLKEIITKLDNLMGSARKTQFDAIGYRCEAYSSRNKHLARILDLKPGDNFTDNTYRYVTGNIEYAKNFGNFRDVRVIYNYLIPKGSTCIGTCESTCALLPKETVSEILSIDKSDPANIIINAIARTS